MPYTPKIFHNVKRGHIGSGILAAALMTVFGFIAFAQSIHDPSLVGSVIQWIALPLFSGGFAVGIIKSDLLAWLAVFAGLVIWSLIFTVLFASSFWSRLPD